MWSAKSSLIIYLSTHGVKTLLHVNSLTTIYTFSWLGGPEVTESTGLREVPCSNVGSSKDFYGWCLVLLLLCFNFFVQNTIFVTNCCHSFGNINSCSILKWQNIWQIIRISKYIPSVLKKSDPKRYAHIQWNRLSDMPVCT